MAVCATTKRGALNKFKRLMRDEVGEIEADELELDGISIGYLRLPAPTEGDEEYEWFVDYREERKNNFPVFVYRT